MPLISGILGVKPLVLSSSQEARVYLWAQYSLYKTENTLSVSLYYPSRRMHSDKQWSKTPTGAEFGDFFFQANVQSSHNVSFKCALTISAHLWLAKCLFFGTGTL